MIPAVALAIAPPAATTSLPARRRTMARRSAPQVVLAISHDAAGIALAAARWLVVWEICNMPGRQ